METKFYRCSVCGNIVTKIIDSGVVMECCGRKMEELHPQGGDEEGEEKHVPKVSFPAECKVDVKVGATPHPMLEAHFIQWIFIETEKGGQLVRLQSSDMPEAIFYCGKQRPVAVYEYCNVHGLWGVDVNDGFAENYYC